MGFSTKDEVIEWILRNQLGRRNLTDVQRNEVALKYEEVIAKQMKENSLANLKKGNALPSRPNEPLGNKTSKRKELAKIAGTSEGSIQRTKVDKSCRCGMPFKMVQLSEQIVIL